MAFKYFLGCCGCCSALRPRYKRLVDNIFPENPEDGLVKSNMEKLTFYSLVGGVLLLLVTFMIYVIIDLFYSVHLKNWTE